ncbi:hypothetical protein LCGC14_0531330 [marine sediment metagenome]|uniref:Uncharacterized protein n=1 Tax=marine sediment metagenome TaxID=412755 RepID=A0A0F9SDW2_9ZZZZ
MPYEITSPCCGHTQIYKPRGDKLKEGSHTNCKKCSKDFSIDIKLSELISKLPNISKKITKSNKKLSSHSTTTTGRGSTSLLPLIPEYQDVNIKSLLKNWSIHQLYTNSKFSGQAMQTLTKPEFIEQGQIVQGRVYWTSDMPPYHRPDWLYPWQKVGIDLMLLGHCLWQAGRQLVGKTTGAGFANFEDMLMVDNTVVGLAAPGVRQCENLLRQMFKEVITLEDGTKFDLWNQLFKPYFIVDNVDKYVMKNGSMIYIIPLSETTAPGAAIDILHIEEIDKAVDDPQKLRGLGAIIPTIRARKDKAKIRITCNVKSAVYRVLREELKQFGEYFPIYMEKPYNTETETFTGEHHIYNEYIEFGHKPDIDEILKVLMDTILGSGYTQAQLGNMDDFEGSMWNPDKLDKAYLKGKTYRFKEHYEHTGMGIDPGAVHAFAITIWGKEGVGKNTQVVKLWSGRFTLSGRTTVEKQKMVKTIAKACAKAYLEFDCEFVAYESNSGALLIVPFIGYYVKKFRDETKFKTSYAKWRERISNFGGDKEQGPQGKLISRADYIMLMQILIDYEMAIIPIISASDNILKLEFARYKPAEKGGKDAKYKGDMVDSSLHIVWHLCGGRRFVREITKMVKREGVYAL